MNMVEGATRWLTYDDMAVALGITAESAKRLAMRRKWPRRPGNDGRALVAVPEDRITDAATHGALDEATGDDTPVIADVTTEDGGGDARALLAYLERRVEELTEELADARTEVRGARFEAESLRTRAGQVDVLTALVAAERDRSSEIRTEMMALVEAERAHLAEVRAERDRLVAMLSERRESRLFSFLDRLRGAA
jgi:hypothetical protein